MDGEYKKTEAKRKTERKETKKENTKATKHYESPPKWNTTPTPQMTSHSKTVSSVLD